MSIEDKIKETKNKNELDSLRLLIIEEMDYLNNDECQKLQKLFIKQKNKLKRNGWLI